MNPNFQPQQFQPQPYQQPKRSGAGCWVGGLVGCLLIIIIGVLVVFFSVRQAIKGSSGFMQGFQGAVKSTQDMVQCVQQMRIVDQALNRYNADHGSYPPNLSALVPSYIPTQSELHCGLDPNTNPNHVSFTYFRPPAGAPKSTTVLSISGSYTMTVAQQSQSIKTTETMALDGTTQQSQSQSMTGPSGTYQTTPGANGTTTGGGM
jgi:hypothetical protein